MLANARVRGYIVLCKALTNTKKISSRDLNVTSSYKTFQSFFVFFWVENTFLHANFHPSN